MWAFVEHILSLPQRTTQLLPRGKQKKKGKDSASSAYQGRREEGNEGKKTKILAGGWEVRSDG